jgi:polyhydroxyalkanoate synthase subunit PhaC
MRKISLRSPSGPTDLALAAFLKGQFGATDILRRMQGDAFAALGFGPSECLYQIVASGSYWRLRDYGDHGAPRSLLVIAAPIKRPYIWDLAPTVSAIRYCLRQNLHMYLLEWMPASRDTSNIGIEECTHAISACVARISTEARGSKPILIGHSLGGTLAALYAAMAPESIPGLVLLGAPLCMQPGESPFRDALVSLIPAEFSAADPFPGSLLSQVSALASPSTFIWSRLMDAALSITDPDAIDLHARVERWALDEAPLPGKLVSQIIEWLYRENRFCRGILRIGNKTIGPSSLLAPTLAVVNTTDAIAPLGSFKPIADALGPDKARIIEFSGEVGVCLQHLGILVGRRAFARVWPEIIAWLDAHG